MEDEKMIVEEKPRSSKRAYWLAALSLAILFITGFVAGPAVVFLIAILSPVASIVGQLLQDLLSISPFIGFLGPLIFLVLHFYSYKLLDDLIVGKKSFELMLVWSGVFILVAIALFMQFSRLSGVGVA